MPTGNDLWFMEPNKTKPDLPRRLFWEYDYERIDWQNEAVSIIERVIERGTREEWEELIAFYGREKIVDLLKHKYWYLREDIIPEVCSYFNLKFEELKCSQRHPWRKGHWP